MDESLWKPAATVEGLRRRAEVLGRIRAFFAERHVLEVETPLLSRATVTDVHLHSIRTEVTVPGGDEPLPLYLQTSPEYAMKRLLAAGSGPIFQLGRAFRDEEGGRHHNPEFTMLEWYRPGWDHHALMDEMEALLTAVLGTGPADRRAYGALFETKLGVDPHRDEPATLRAKAVAHGLEPLEGLDREGWLSLMMTQLLEPNLGRGAPTFVFDYPADQAALARIRPGDPPVAERFEVYVEGVELANGFHELTDPEEQLRRFERDLGERRALGLPEPPIDRRLIAALAHGMPTCSGVALGVDRLVMLATGASNISEVLAFPIDRA